MVGREPETQLFMFPDHVGGGGRIVFGTDPVGVGVASCLHYLLIGWTYFSQTNTNISLGGGKC